MGKTLSTLVVCTISATGALLLNSDEVDAYNQWSVNDDATYCGECHGDFRSGNYISPVDGQLWGNLHNIHRDSMLSGDCAACHLASDEFPVLLDESEGGDGFDPISCIGCHDGPGLRLHHLTANVSPDQNGDTCADCHAMDPAPPAENVAPPYYFTPDAAHPNKPTDPCNPSPGFPENFAGDTIAIDNDGDLLYDEADPDCGAVDMFLDDFESGDTSAWSLTVP